MLRPFIYISDPAKLVGTVPGLLPSPDYGGSVILGQLAHTAM